MNPSKSSTAQTEAIAAGVQILDRIAPDWRAKINPKTLDPNSFDCCILCQVFGSYTKGIDAVANAIHQPAPTNKYSDEARKIVRAFGFYPLGSALDLNIAWAQELGIDPEEWNSVLAYRD
jgi:hypothetical protein